MKAGGALDQEDGRHFSDRHGGLPTPSWSAAGEREAAGKPMWGRYGKVSMISMSSSRR
jgi:hypothetical protein